MKKITKTLKNKYLLVYAFLTFALVLKLINEGLMFISTVNYYYGWDSFLDVVFYIAICVILMIKTNQVCATNNHKLLILPAIYLIWYQGLLVYSAYNSIVLFYPIDQVNSLLIGNLSIKLIVMALLISVVCLIIFKNKHSYLPLILSCLAGVFQIIDTIPKFVKLIAIDFLNEDIQLLDSFAKIQQFTQLITNLCVFAIIIVFLCINQKSNKHREESENNNNVEIITPESN